MVHMYLRIESIETGEAGGGRNRYGRGGDEEEDDEPLNEAAIAKQWISILAWSWGLSHNAGHPGQLPIRVRRELEARRTAALAEVGFDADENPIEGHPAIANLSRHEQYMALEEAKAAIEAKLQEDLPSFTESETAMKRQGRGNMQGLSVTKYAGTSSAELMALCAKPRRNLRAILRICRGKPGEHHWPHEKADPEALADDAENPPAISHEIRMRNVTIRSISTGGSGGQDRFTENLRIQFDSMEMEMFDLNNPDHPANKKKQAKKQAKLAKAKQTEEKKQDTVKPVVGTSASAIPASPSSSSASPSSASGSGACEEFEANLFRPNVCKRCFAAKKDHGATGAAAAAPAPTPAPAVAVAPTPAPAAAVAAPAPAAPTKQLSASVVLDPMRGVAKLAADGKPIVFAPLAAN